MQRKRKTNNVIFYVCGFWESNESIIEERKQNIKNALTSTSKQFDEMLQILREDASD